MSLGGKTVFVTGATGCLGRNLVSHLLENGCKEIRCLVRKERDTLSNVNNSKIKYFFGTLEDIEEIKAALINVDYVVHCAAKVHSYNKNAVKEYYYVNYVQTKKLLELCKTIKVPRVIMISTVAVYENSLIISEQNALKPKTDYGKSKLMAEEYALELYKKDDFPITILQLGTLFGRFDRGNFLTLLKVIRNRIVPIVGNGENVKNFTYVKDAVNAITLTMGNDKTIGKRMIIADSESISLNHLIKRVALKLNKKILIIKIPTSLTYVFFSVVDRLFNKSYISKIKAIVNETNFNASLSKRYLGEYITYGFLDGLDDCIEWYKDALRGRNI